ncbi:MAG: hypothetical protein RDV48_14180, partial [Candidatus Eremiobacteraeota bacterium]|nr:hypothetical protein [Candidatus Eremiobacteraeota bacterium]
QEEAQQEEAQQEEAQQEEAQQEEAQQEEAQQEEAQQEEAPTAPQEEEIDPNWLIEEIEKGNEHLEKKEYEKSMELFFALYGRVSDNQDVLKGLFFSYCGFNCWIEAYDVSKKIAIALLDGEEKKAFVNALQDVIQNRLNQVRNKEQQKMYMSELAELLLLHSNKKQRAREILKEAYKISERTSYDEKILFYLSGLMVEEGAKNTGEYLYTYLEQYGERMEVYDNIDQFIKKEPASPKIKVIDRIKDYLSLPEKEVNEAFKAKIEEDVFPQAVQLSPAIFKNIDDPRESWITNFFTEKVFPIVPLDSGRLSKNFSTFLKSSKPAKFQEAAEKEVKEFNNSIFKIENLEILQYSGHQPFFLLVAPSDSPSVILNLSNLKELSEIQRKFIILHELAHHFRHHTRIWAMADVLTAEEKLKFTPLIKELFEKTHTDMPGRLEERLDGLAQEGEKAVVELEGLLQELQEGVESIQLLNLFEFLTQKKPFRSIFNVIADRFALLGVRNLKEATQAIVRDEIKEDWVLEEIRNKGLSGIFAPEEKFADVKRRVQDLWVYTLRNYPTKK